MTAIADGATGSLLQSRGHEGCLERLNLEAPEAVRQLHLDYLDAGAEWIWTNSFGGSPARLAGHGLADRAEEVNREAARLALAATADRARVAGSVGPCGVPLAPFGDMEPAALAEGARRQLRGLAEGGVHAFAVETMMDVEEAALLIRTAREVAPEIPVFATLTFQETPRGLFTPFGNAPGEAAARLVEEGASMVGANCGTGPGPMREIARAMREATDRPLLFRPNAGMPVLRDGRATWPETPERFAAAVRELIDLGAEIVGGCCGTTPDHIRALTSVR